MSVDYNKIPFIKARYFTEATPQSRVEQLIVIHTMEAPEKGETAENIAKYFNKMPDGRRASAHYCIDNNSIVQCVQCKDVAWAAPNANRNGIHLEHAGYAAQLGVQWNDEYSQEMLKLSAELCGFVLMPKFEIPDKWLTLEEIVESYKDKTIRGFCTHADITKAWKAVDKTYSGSHTDPGPYFPKNGYMEMVRKAFHSRR